MFRGFPTVLAAITLVACCAFALPASAREARAGVQSGRAVARTSVKSTALPAQSAAPNLRPSVPARQRDLGRSAPAPPLETLKRSADRSTSPAQRAGATNDSEPGVGETDPNERSGGPGLDRIPVTGAIDPVEMGGLDPYRRDGGTLDTCVGGRCECVGDDCDGGEAAVAANAPGGAVDPQGGFTDPTPGGNDRGGEGGGLDPCAVSPDCETSDHGESQEAESDPSETSDCDEDEPGFECDQDATDDGDHRRSQHEGDSPYDGQSRDGAQDDSTSGEQKSGASGDADSGPSQYSGTVLYPPSDYDAQKGSGPGHDSQHEGDHGQGPNAVPQHGPDTAGQPPLRVADAFNWFGNAVEPPEGDVPDHDVDGHQVDVNPHMTGKAEMPGFVELSEVVDTDGDGISDNDEKNYGTNPGESDSDHDGLMDSVELGVDGHDGTKTDPLDADSDGDGIGDGMEIGAGTDPRDPLDTPPDDDEDGIPNSLDRS